MTNEPEQNKDAESAEHDFTAGENEYSKLSDSAKDEAYLEVGLAPGEKLAMPPSEYELPIPEEVASIPQLSPEHASRVKELLELKRPLTDEEWMYLESATPIDPYNSPGNVDAKESGPPETPPGETGIWK